jgi:hypothetical protein
VLARCSDPSRSLATVLLPWDFHSPSETSQVSSGRLVCTGQKDPRTTNDILPRGFFPLQRFPTSGSGIVGLGLPPRDHLHLRAFSAPWCFRPPMMSAGLISCRIRSWGCCPSELCSSRVVDRLFSKRSFPHVISCRVCFCAVLIPSEPTSSVPTNRYFLTLPHPGDFAAARAARDSGALLHTRVRHFTSAV